jgi:hypothetical protein
MFFEKEKAIWDPTSKSSFTSTHSHMCLKGKTTQSWTTPSIPKKKFNFIVLLIVRNVVAKKSKKCT